MPKYYEYKVCGYYLYYTSHCIIEAMIREEGKLQMICELVSKKLLPIETALEHLNISETELYTTMKKFKYMI